jgi:hypothetical protein
MLLTCFIGTRGSSIYPNDSSFFNNSSDITTKEILKRYGDILKAPGPQRMVENVDSPPLAQKKATTAEVVHQELHVSTPMPTKPVLGRKRAQFDMSKNPPALHMRPIVIKHRRRTSSSSVFKQPLQAACRQ